jgi:hypothetical protein
MFALCDARARYSAIERLEVQLRQESEGAKLQVAQKKRTDDDFWNHWESEQQVERRARVLPVISQANQSLQAMLVHQPAYPSAYDSYPSPAISFGMATPHGAHHHPYGGAAMYQPSSAMPPISARSHAPPPTNIPSAAGL